MGSYQALLAAVIVACDPVLVVQSRSVMTETLTAFLIAAALAGLATRAGPPWRAGAIGGFWFGLAALCRPSTLPAAGFAAVSALALGPGSARERVTRSLALAFSTLVTLLPWAARNAFVLGTPVWTTTHGGYTLALANNDVYYAEVVNGPPGAVWSGPNQRKWFDWVNEATAGMSETQADQFLRAAALRMLAEHPGTFARAALARLARFWAIQPAAAVYRGPLRALTAAWTVPLFLALFVSLTKKSLWRWPRAAAPACLIALSAVHALYWTDLRMRAPVVPAIALVAAWAFCRKAEEGSSAVMETALGP
jgi:4-amino-4-deoxy-L-arabinose transferase-like glycosyltransferase